MNTVEVTVEQVLAGIIALFVCAVPFIQPDGFEQLSKTFVAVGVLGVAYLVGAAVDKLFDTVLGGAEQWTRLRVAMERDARSWPVEPAGIKQALTPNTQLASGPQGFATPAPSVLGSALVPMLPGGSASSASGSLATPPVLTAAVLIPRAQSESALRSSEKADPFDQGRLEVELRRNEVAGNWMSYLRARVRLTRTLGVAGPLVALAASVALMFAESGGTQTWGEVVQVPRDLVARAWALIAPAILLIGVTCAAVVRMPKTHEWDYDHGQRQRDSGRANLGTWPSRCWIWNTGCPKILLRGSSSIEVTRSLMCWSLLAWLPVICVYTAVLVAAVVASWSSKPFPVFVVASGCVVGGLSLWSWNRVLLSYMTFVANSAQ